MVDILPLERRLRAAHYHANAEFGTVLGGPGRLYFQDHYRDLNPGDVYLLDCVVPHGHEAPRAGSARNLYVHVKYDAIPSLTPPDEYAAFMRPLMLIRAGILSPVVSGASDVCDELRRAHQLYSESDRTGYVAAWAHVVAACALLLARLERSIVSSAPTRAGQREQVAVATALHLIGRRFTEPLTVEELARACCLSPSRFAHLFTAYLSVSPIAYRNSLRINRALELLHATQQTVEQIALDTGFRSFGQFRRLFKSSTGQSPREFRRQQHRIGFRQEGR